MFFITSGMILDIKGLVQDPRALAGVPVLIVALLVVRGLPMLSLRHELSLRELLGAAVLQATSLPFLLTVAQVGVQMRLFERTTAAALIAAGVVSVLLFPPLSRRLLTRPTETEPPGTATRIRNPGDS